MRIFAFSLDRCGVILKTVCLSDDGGWLPLLPAILFGSLGEYNGRIYDEGKQCLLYIVKDEQGVGNQYENVPFGMDRTQKYANVMAFLRCRSRKYVRGFHCLFSAYIDWSCRFVRASVLLYGWGGQQLCVEQAMDVSSKAKSNNRRVFPVYHR
jgi:hypothetical protein